MPSVVDPEIDGEGFWRLGFRSIFDRGDTLEPAPQQAAVPDYQLCAASTALRLKECSGSCARG